MREIEVPKESLREGAQRATKANGFAGRTFGPTCRQGMREMQNLLELGVPRHGLGLILEGSRCCEELRVLEKNVRKVRALGAGVCCLLQRELATAMELKAKRFKGTETSKTIGVNVIAWDETKQEIKLDTQSKMPAVGVDCMVQRRSSTLYELTFGSSR